MPIVDEDKDMAATPSYRMMAVDNQYLNVGKSRVTPDTLTRFEVARLVGVRARMIELTG